jgi:protein-S-isoprenylcysteine O-methyltransferase Ste14
VGPFSFRPAPERGRRSHLLHSLAQLVCFWAAFLVAVPVVIRWAEVRLRLDWSWLDGPAIASSGVVVFALGSAVGLWSCVSMALLGEGTPLPASAGRILVVAGPYRFVRNPMAAAGAVQTIGAGLYLGSWLVVLSAFAGGIVWNTFIRPEEESDLAQRFGSPYERYRNTVRCWVPSLRASPGRLVAPPPRSPTT